LLYHKPTTFIETNRSIKKLKLNQMNTNDNLSINQVRKLLAEARRVFVLTGAGVSAESGVPTFRGGGGTTVWRGMPFEQLSSKQMVEKDLPLVWEWFDYRRGIVGECEPNAAHLTLAKIEQNGRFEEFSVVTQNVDGLHQAAGTKGVIELHGTLRQARCLSCKHAQSLTEIPIEERPPVCPKCFDSMRPDVVLFGEAMPMEAFYAALEKAKKCDVCIFVGTSALVYPAAELPLIAKQSDAKIIEVNPEETGLSDAADVSLRGKAAEILPLIFAENDTPNLRLPDEKSIKSSVEQTRKENQAERKNESVAAENSNQSEQQSKAGIKSSESHPLRVDFVQSEAFPVLNCLGMTFAPGKKQQGAMSGDWNRNMYRDMLRLREHYGIDLQVSLLEDEEFNELGLIGFEGQSQRRGISLIKFPIRDVSVPTSMKSFAKMIREIVRQLNDGKKVVVHCKGGLGRTGLTTACAIVAASGNRISSTEAVKMVRQSRPGAVETRQQENFVALFEEYWQIYSERIESLLNQQKTAVSEKVLEIKSKGLIERLFRFPTYDGRYYFYLTEQYPQSPNYDNYNWEAEPVPSFREALELLSNHYQFVPYKTPFIHPEYRAEFRTFLEKVIKDTSASFTFEEWLVGEDDPGVWDNTVDNTSDENNERENNVEIDWSERRVELSDKHFLLCWKEQSVFAAKSSPHPLDVVSSRQLNRVKAGDTIWIVFVNQEGELVLAGRLKAAEVVDYLTAVRRLHDANLWDGDYYALAEENTAEKINLINLGQKAFDLRFKKSGSDRLTATNGKIKAQQLGSMRELTAESAQMLTEIWENAVFDFDTDDDFDWDDNEEIPEESAADLLEFCRQAVSEQPESADAHYNLGVACDENDLPEEANVAYQKAIELNQGYWQAYYNLGQNYLRKGEFNKAEDAFIHAALLNKGFAEAHFMLGVVYAAQNKHLDSIDATMRGLTYSSDDAKAHFNVGNSYYHLRDYQMAAEWFEKSLEIDQNAPNAFYMLGKCYRNLGSKLKELNAYRQAVEIIPDFFDALSAAGTAYAHLTGTPEGEQVSYFEPGNEFSLLDAQVFFYMGLGLLALGNVEEARGTQEHLRETDASLAERLQFFIDRFVPEDESENDSEEFDLQWLEPEESDFNISVLDCRPFTETRVSFAAEDQNARTFLSTRDLNGEHHRGKSPANARSFSCDLSYAINALIYSSISNRSFEIRDLPEGKLFSAAEMEEKWDVFYFDKYFYFVRSWTDKIAYRARAEEEGLYLNITEIEYNGETAEDKNYHLRAVDYLLKTFVIGLIVPHPIPPDVENTPESIALFSFSFAGRHAKFASYEDTISAIFPLQPMDYVGPFDQERIREWREKENTSAADGEVKDTGNRGETSENTAATNSKVEALGSKKRELIKVFIDGQSFEAKNIPELYKAVLQYLVDAGKLENIFLPVATGNKRNILAKEPVHPTGKSFLVPVEYGGFFMEAHNNRQAAIAQLEKLIESLGCRFSLYSLDELAKKVNERKMDVGQIGTYIWVELEEGNITGVEHFLEEIGEPRMFEEWIAEAKQKAEQEEKPKNQGLSSIMQNSKVNVFRGCLLGGAIGDALGAAIEFDSIQTIRQRFGEQGLTDYAPVYGRIGAITDDTQMTLFTAEGLLRAITRENHKGICHPPTIIYHAYLRWLETQGEKISSEQIKRWVYDEKSWLRDLPELNSRRAPGNSCLSALRSGKMGTIEEPINNSKGCGGVMRVAPIGLIADDAFNLACEAAAITHGHPTGYLSAGVFALILRQIVDGKGLPHAINHAVYEELPKHKNQEEIFAACDKAVKMARDQGIVPNPKTIESLGGGWIAEEALAIAIYCSLVFENDFEKAVLLAVNHSGDSDSTGAIAGNILGALHGREAIPRHWIEGLELKEAIIEIAEDLFVGSNSGELWLNKYPGI
jgi:NAD-dependent SIR2 family protein deacetylase/ADP-ribosylglycohydrolase/protein-tyrosine phosphatase/TPR repeat protein